MKSLSTCALAAFLLGASGASAQQAVLVPWNQSWSFMHPMGVFPEVPPGGDGDFETTWQLGEVEFEAQYNGPAFGAVPEIAGDSATLDSFDSGISEAPLGYEVISYFGSAGAELTGFGDDDGDPGNGLAGELTIPASGQRRAAYFRTTFTVPSGNGALVRPVLRYLIDDGAYIYLDGELAAAVNMAATTPADRDAYATAPQVNAADATDTESDLRLLDLTLPAGSTTGGSPEDATVVPNARVVKQFLSLAEGEHTLAVSVRSNSQTSSDMVMAIELAAETGCVIAAEASNVVRSNAGTPFNPNDDTFSFNVTVDSVNGGASWSSDSAGAPTGSYGVPVPFGPFPVAGGARTITFTAASDAGCTAPVTVTPPGGTIVAAAQSYARDQRGTLSTADDTFTATVALDSQFVSASWVTTGTTPLGSSPGTPVGGNYMTPRLFGPYPVAGGSVTVTFADAVNPLVTTSLVLGSPVFLGSRSLGGSLTNLLSTAPLPAEWVTNGAVQPTLTMSNGIGDLWREFRSEVVNLTSVGALAFSAELVARENSDTTNFELADAFRAKLVLTGPGGTTEVSLITAFDTDGNGMVNGVDVPYDPAFDEFNRGRRDVAALLDETLPLYASIPASAQSAQLVVEAKNISGSEFFDVRNITFGDGCAFTARAASVLRNVHGEPTNTAAHTLDITLRATATGLVSPLGWSVDFTRGGVPVPGASASGGAYNADVAFTGMPAEGGPITVVLTDRGDPACFVALLVIAPEAPVVVGMARLEGVESVIYSDGSAPGWVEIAGGLEMRLAPALSDFVTETVDLSGIGGSVAFSMSLQAEDMSTGSNFEAADVFLAELILDDGIAPVTVNLVGAFDRAVDGQMNGNAAVALDDFNPFDQPVGDLLDNTFPMAYTIPDSILSATLRIRARADANTETFRVRDVLFLSQSGPGDGDSDGDGVSDADESIAGTDPNNAASVFKVTGFTAATPGNFNAGFPTVAGRFYRGYVSTNLVTWTRDDSRAAVTGNGSPAAWPFAPVPQGGVPTRYLKMAVAASAADFPATLP